MKCENCNDRSATFFFEQSINGEKHSRHLCHTCAESLGFIRKGQGLLDESFSPLFGSHTAMLDEIFGFAGQGIKAQKCEGCGATWQELARSGKVGCPRCYQTFGEALQPTLRSLHGNVTHTGRAPADRLAKRERKDKLTELRRALGEAVAAENFEDAARIRDEIRALEKEEG